MARIHVESERTIDAAPSIVYDFLTDYRDQHYKILPSEHYLDYTVEQGGHGSGTVFGYVFSAANRKRNYHLRVEELTKGEVLTESDLGSSLVNTWTVSGQDGGQRSRVRLTTEWEGSGGMGGFFERTFAPGSLRRIYDDVLRRLESSMSATGSKS